MLTKPSDKSPNKFAQHGRMTGISIYTPDENKWANYVPLRKNHSTSKADPASKPLYQNDLENEFKKALDSMKRQRTEKRTTVSSTRIPAAKSTKGAISRLRQENNDKLNESLERSFSVKNSNLQTTGRSSRSINCMGGSSVASNLSNTHDLDGSVNKSLNGIDSPQLESSKKLNSKSLLQRDRSTSSIKDSAKKINTKSPIQKSKSKLDPSPSPNTKSLASPKMLNFKTLNSVEKEKPETPSKSPTFRGNIKKINSATNLIQTSQTMISKTKNSASQNKITPIKQKTAGDKLIGLLGPNSESKSKKFEHDSIYTSGKKTSYIEKNLKDLTITDRLEKANADLKRKQEELALSYKKYALEKFVSKIDKYFYQLFIGEKREGFIQILSEIQRQNIKITQFLAWQEESIKRSCFDQILIHRDATKRRLQETSEKVKNFITTKYTNKFFRLWKNSNPSYTTSSESRMNSIRQNSLDSIWHNKRESIEFDSSRKMSRINSSIDRLSLSKAGIIPTFSDSKIDKAIAIANSSTTKELKKIDQSEEISNSQLEQSFGYETIPRESIQTEQVNETVLAGLSPSKDIRDCDECIPDQIITHIPKPITKEAAPIGQWADKENKRSLFEKKPTKKTSSLKEPNTKLNENNINNALKQSKSDVYTGNRLDKSPKANNEKKPPITKTHSNLQSRGSIIEKENPILLEKAKTYYNKRLMKTIGFAPLQRIWNKSKMKNLEANEFKKLNLIKKVFRILENGHIEINESICSVKSDDKRGERHYKLMLKINAFNSFLKNFVQSFEEAETYNKIRDDFIKRKVFTKWFLHKEEIKSDIDDSCDGYDCIIEKFRFIILAEKSLKSFRKNSDEEKLARLKVEKKSIDSRKSPISSSKSTGRAIKF